MFIKNWDVPTQLNSTISKVRGVATAGGRVPRAPYHAPYIKMTTDSLSSELTFDE